MCLLGILRIFFPENIHEEAMSTLVISRDRMKGHKKFFSYDRTKKIMNHEIKVFSRWHVDRMMIILLDSDAAAGTNVKTAEAIDTFFN